MEKAISALGYRPNMFARGLMRAATDTVGILVPYITNPYFMSIVGAIEHELALRNIRIYLCATEESEEKELRYVDELARRGVDALIFVETPSVNREGRALPLEARGLPMPIILVNEHRRLDSPFHVVRCAQEPGFIAALDYLLDRDLLPLRLLLGERLWSFEIKERLFLDRVVDRGVRGEDVAVARLPGVNAEEVIQRCAAYAEESLGSPRPPRAFFAGNDLMGAGLVQGIRTAGLRVPEDVAVIGVDDSLPARLSVPPLSTVDLREAEVGKMAADLYFALKEGSEAEVPARRVIDSVFVRRGTA